MKSDAPRPEEIRGRSEDVDLAVQELLESIASEPVPERLLILAVELQKALRNRTLRNC
jgi:hypothetical protein